MQSAASVENEAGAVAAKGLRYWRDLNDALAPGAAGYGRAILAALAAVVALNALARGQTLFDPLYSPDSYALLGADPAVIVHDQLGNGRFGWVLVNDLLTGLGYPVVRSASAQSLIAMFGFVGAAWLFARTLFDDLRPLEVFAFAAVFTLHPLSSEFFYFSEATLRTALAMLCAAGAGWAALAARPSTASRAGATVGTLVAASIYQLVIADLGVVATLCALKLLTTTPHVSQTHRWRRLAEGIGCIGVGLALYLVTARGTRWIWPDIGSGQFFAPMDSNWLWRLTAPAKVALLALMPGEGVGPLFVCVVAAAGAAMCAMIVVSKLATEKGAAAAALGGLVVLSALYASQMVVLFEGNNAFVTARVMSPIVLAMAGLFVFGFRAADARMRDLLALALAVALAGCVGASSSLLFEQRRLNRWDSAEANRVVARLEASPDFAPGLPLAVVGSQLRHSYSDTTVWGTLKVSSLRASWSQPGVFEEATGYRFASPSPDQAAIAQTYCAGTRAWPAPDSAVVRERIAIVCLPQ